jgi:hypothetical protein
MWQEQHFAKPLNPTETPSPANQTPQLLELISAIMSACSSAWALLCRTKRVRATAHSNPCVEPPTVVKLMYSMNDPQSWRRRRSLVEADLISAGRDTLMSDII